MAGPEGEAYFAKDMKDSGIPKNTFKGTIVDGKPACRSKELLVSVPEPNQQGTAPTVITLKLEAPLKGKVEPGAVIQFGGVPSAFSKDPFMLTLDIEQAEITDLTTSTCVAAPTKAPAGKKGGGKKK